MPEIEVDNPEIEKFLLEKLQSSITKNRPYSSMFKKMKSSLEKQLKIATDANEKLKIREKLFHLNNLINEIDSNFAYLSWSRFRRLNHLHKEIKSAEIKPAAAASSTPAARSVKSTRETATKRALGLNADELAFRNLILYQTGTRRKDFNAIGIVGAEGVGKTTLAQSIFNQAEVKQQFLPRIWISLSPDPIDNDEISEIAIAKRILQSLGISDETINSITQSAASTGKLAALIHAIRLELTGKRYLVVLDNASRMEDWYTDLRLEMTPVVKKAEEKLAFAFPKGRGGTVLVVGWPERVVEAMVGGDGSGIHRLLPLEDPNLCLEIYKEAAGGIEDDMKVEDEVVKRSNRLPKAAWLMGMIAKRNQEIATTANPAVES